MKNFWHTHFYSRATGFFSVRLQPPTAGFPITITQLFGGGHWSLAIVRKTGGTVAVPAPITADEERALRSGD